MASASGISPARSMECAVGHDPANTVVTRKPKAASPSGTGILATIELPSRNDFRRDSIPTSKSSARASAAPVLPGSCEYGVAAPKTEPAVKEAPSAAVLPSARKALNADSTPVPAASAASGSAISALVTQTHEEAAIAGANGNPSPCRLLRRFPPAPEPASANQCHSRVAGRQARATRPARSFRAPRRRGKAALPGNSRPRQPAKTRPRAKPADTLPAAGDARFLRAATPVRREIAGAAAPREGPGRSLPGSRCRR